MERLTIDGDSDNFTIKSFYLFSFVVKYQFLAIMQGIKDFLLDTREKKNPSVLALMELLHPMIPCDTLTCELLNAREHKSQMLKMYAEKLGNFAALENIKAFY